MRLFRRIKDPVEGTAQVAGATGYSGEGTWQTVRMNLVVQAPGVEPFTLEHQGLARADKWPYPGMTLPVVFDREHHDRIDIRWDRVPSGKERARERAEQLRASLAGPGAPGPVPPAAQGIVDQLQRAFPGAQIQVQGGHVDDGAGVSADDRVSALERLARLHASGALTDAEFAAEKRRLLGT